MTRIKDNVYRYSGGYARKEMEISISKLCCISPAGEDFFLLMKEDVFL